MAWGYPSLSAILTRYRGGLTVSEPPPERPPVERRRWASSNRASTGIRMRRSGAPSPGMKRKWPSRRSSHTAVASFCRYERVILDSTR